MEASAAGLSVDVCAARKPEMVMQSKVEIGKTARGFAH